MVKFYTFAALNLASIYSDRCGDGSRSVNEDHSILVNIKNRRLKHKRKQNGSGDERYSSFPFSSAYASASVELPSLAEPEVEE